MTTLAPSAARAPALRCAAREPAVGANTSGAPITHDPRPTKLAPLHLREDANGTMLVGIQSAGAGSASATAASVAFG
jgi:hypothetical protein